ncbi:MAG TPA: HEAT repeat domain-containing protein [Vicinamibacterales bacterium]|nr:HEAT repeat domain-containing protein [Vicinamibacterales bacterium]
MKKMRLTTLMFAAALVAAPSWAQTPQTPEPPRRVPEAPRPLSDPGSAPALDLRVPLEALSAALAQAQEQIYAQRRDGQGRPQDARNGRESQWDVVYERARQAIERAQWAQALQQFTTLAEAKAPRSDAAMYWRAYTLDKMNRHTDALAAVGELFKNFPTSRWVSDARALELQVRQRSGQSVPVDSGDDELKLLALQGLQQIAPERAVPLLVKVISDVGSPRLKERALFVLSQSAAPEARATLEKVARGTGNPELQMKAVQYIGMSGQPGRMSVLNDIYVAAADLDVKRQVLRSFTMAGDRQRVLVVAQTEKSPELRTEAVRQLAMLGARDELWQMYQKESETGVKQVILGSLAMAGATPRVIEIATTDRDAGIRLAAVRQLGMFGGTGATATLTSLYAKEQDIQVRRAAIDALFFHGNADALVSLARSETNPVLRRELVQKLSMMRSPAAIEYLTEILK